MGRPLSIGIRLFLPLFAFRAPHAYTRCSPPPPGQSHWRQRPQPAARHFDTMTGTLDARPKVGYVYLGKKVDGDILENISKIRVGDIMSKPVTVNDDTMVYDAIVHLFLHDVGTLFVESNGSLVGAVSRKDFLKIAIGGTDIHKVPVGIIMTRMPNIIYGTVEDSAYTLAKKIIEHEIDSIQIVEKSYDSDDEKFNLKIVGKISKTNITKLFVNLGEAK